MVVIAYKLLPSLKIVDSSSGSVFFPVKLVNSIFDKHLFLSTFSMDKCGIPHSGFMFSNASGTHTISHTFVWVFWVKLSLTRGYSRLVKTRSTWFIEISCSMISNFLWLVNFRGSLSYEMKFLCSFKTALWLQWTISSFKEFLASLV